MANNPVNAYRQTRIKTASQGRIIVMLYEEAIRQIDIAKQALSENTKQLDRVNNSIGKAQDITHDTPEDVADGVYGPVMQFMKRPLSGHP